MARLYACHTVPRRYDTRSVIDERLKTGRILYRIRIRIGNVSPPR